MKGLDSGAPEPRWAGSPMFRRGKNWLAPMAGVMKAFSAPAMMLWASAR